LIPLLLIALVAGGAFFFARQRDSSAPGSIVPSVSPTAPVSATATAPAAAVPPVAQAPEATVAPTLSTPTAAASAQAAQPTTASGPGGLPVLPRGTASATTAASGTAQRARVSGTIRFTEGVTAPESFPNGWIVVLIAQSDFQQQRQAATPKARSRIENLPITAQYGFSMDLDLPAESQESTYVIQVRQETGGRVAVLDSSELRVERGNRALGVTVPLRVTGFSEEIEPRPSQAP
jgi:hypothetical protein